MKIKKKINVLYLVTKEELQQIAQKRISRVLTADEIGYLVDRVVDELLWIIPVVIDDIDLREKGYILTAYGEPKSSLNHPDF